MKKIAKAISASFLLAVFAALPAGAALDTACVVTAVEKRDNAIISAWDTYSAQAKTALETRRDSLKTAWGDANKATRKASLRRAWRTYKSTIRTARRELKASRVRAWNTFKSEVRTCGGATSDEGNTSSDEATM